MADDLKGKATHPDGRIKEGPGDRMGDRETEREGRLDQMEGRTEQDQTRADEDFNDAATRREISRLARDM